MSNWVVPGYTDIRELGRGAAGRVVLAWHDATGTPVAIKYLSDTLRGDDDQMRSFRAEARLLVEMDDPNVARLYEYVETPDGAAIVMELVDGVSLRAMLSEHGPTEPTAALAVLKGSLLGLATAHARGIVHRDYKPENVLVDTEGRSRLADFGIAVRLGRAGPLAGTPTYMAPEQWSGGPASPHTDIYAATATFYECLTGQPPFAAGDLIALSQQHAQAPIPADNAPEPVRSLVRRGLAKNPTDRPADATVFVAELEAAATGAYGDGWEEDGRGKLARRVALLALLLPGSAGLVGGTAVATTVLGSLRWSRRVLIGIGTTVVIATGVGSCIALANPDNPGPPVAIVTPATSASPTVDPSPSPSPEPSVTPSTITVVTTSPTPVTTSKKPPAPIPTPTVTLLRITPSYYQVCPGLACVVNVRVRIDVATSNSRPVTLNVVVAGSTSPAPGNINVKTYTFQLSGATTYVRTIPEDLGPPYGKILACITPRHRVTVKATVSMGTTVLRTADAALSCA